MHHKTDYKKRSNYYQKTIDTLGARSIPTNPNLKNNQKGKVNADNWFTTWEWDILAKGRP